MRRKDVVVSLAWHHPVGSRLVSPLLSVITRPGAPGRRIRASGTAARYFTGPLTR